ncbi:hypothetical protein MMC17_007015 [Xylographa soralifera]|nr:hypothetical protein [Xylographa soralifera]
MNVFPQRSQDGTSTPRTPQGVSAPSTRASTIHEQSARSLPDHGGVVLVRQPVGSSEQTTEDMGDGSSPTEARNYSGPPGSPAFNAFDPHSTNGTAPVSREGRLVDGFSNNDHSSERLGASGEYDTAPQQTPTPTSATPVDTPTRSYQAVGIPPSLPDSSLDGAPVYQPLNPQSTMTDSQASQPPVTQPVQERRRRRRFIDWLRRHRSHRHGPWAPFIRRNWDAVSDAIREVEIRGFGSPRQPEVNSELIMD